MNYQELIQNLPDWAFTGGEQALRVAPQWVRRAEQKLFRDLERDAFRATANGVLSAGINILDLRTYLPVEIRRLKIVIDDNDVVLLPRNLEFLEALFTDRSELGEPSFYAELSDHGRYQLFVTPEIAWTWEAIITKQPTFLSVSNPTGILSDRFGNLLDLETWRQAAVFKRDFEAADRYLRDYAAELAIANAEIKRSKRDDSQTRPRDTSNTAGS